MDATCKICGGPWQGAPDGRGGFVQKGYIVHDPHYIGPRGHCPKRVCFGCWVILWAGVESEIRREYARGKSRRGPKSRLYRAVWLMCHGHTEWEAARAIGMGERTLRRKLAVLRENPGNFSNFLAEFGLFHLGTIQRGEVLSRRRAARQDELDFPHTIRSEP